MKIQEIKAAYQALDPDDEPMLQQFIHTYGTDARSGVQTLVEQTKKKLVQLEAEYVRSEKMLAFERKYHAMGSRYICGIDEVGRGPLAGPVVACAVILPEDEMLLHLNDSKQVPRKKRAILSGRKQLLMVLVLSQRNGLTRSTSYRQLTRLCAWQSRI